MISMEMVIWIDGSYSADDMYLKEALELSDSIKKPLMIRLRETDSSKERRPPASRHPYPKLVLSGTVYKYGACLIESAEIDEI